MVSFPHLVLSSGLLHVQVASQDAQKVLAFLFSLGRCRLTVSCSFLFPVVVSKGHGLFEDFSGLSVALLTLFWRYVAILRDGSDGATKIIHSPLQSGCSPLYRSFFGSVGCQLEALRLVLEDAHGVGQALSGVVTRPQT